MGYSQVKALYKVEYFCLYLEEKIEKSLKVYLEEDMDPLPPSMLLSLNLSNLGL